VRSLPCLKEHHARFSLPAGGITDYRRSSTKPTIERTLQCFGTNATSIEFDSQKQNLTHLTQNAGNFCTFSPRFNQPMNGRILRKRYTLSRDNKSPEMIETNAWQFQVATNGFGYLHNVPLTTKVSSQRFSLQRLTCFHSKRRQ
jgi:hypothetical protein